MPGWSHAAELDKLGAKLNDLVAAVLCPLRGAVIRGKRRLAQGQ